MKVACLLLHFARVAACLPAANFDCLMIISIKAVYDKSNLLSGLPGDLLLVNEGSHGSCPLVDFLSIHELMALASSFTNLYNAPF